MDMLTGGTYENIGGHIPSGACTVNYTCGLSNNTGQFPCDWRLHTDAVFNCSELPVCTTTCDGPHEVIIGLVSEQCSCTSEWFIHASVLYLSLAAGIYLSLNISRYNSYIIRPYITNKCNLWTFTLTFVWNVRMFLNKGLVILFWRELCADRLIEVLVSSNIFGDFVFDRQMVLSTLFKSREPAPMVSEGVAGFSHVGAVQWSHDNPQKTTKSLRADVALAHSPSDREVVGPKTSSNYPSAEKDLLKGEIAKTIRSYDGQMYYYFFFSLVVHVPWLVSLFFFRDNLTYIPNNNNA